MHVAATHLPCSLSGLVSGVPALSWRTRSYVLPLDSEFVYCMSRPGTSFVKHHDGLYVDYVDWVVLALEAVFQTDFVSKRVSPGL